MQVHTKQKKNVYFHCFYFKVTDFIFYDLIHSEYFFIALILILLFLHFYDLIHF